MHKRIASTWPAKMLGYLSTDIIRSKKRTVFREHKTRGRLELRGTDNVQGQISKHVFAPNGGYCVYYSSNLFCSMCSFENWGIFLDFPQFWIFGHMICLDQSHTSKHIWWIITWNIPLVTFIFSVHTLSPKWLMCIDYTKQCVLSYWWEHSIVFHLSHKL